MTANGYTVVPFGSRHYGDWMAAVEMHQASFIAERYDETGNLIKVFKPLEDYGESFLENPSYRRNPSISIGREFFSAAIKDYDDWKEKWWREAIQNSVDAGAKNILCVEERLPQGIVRITVIDDGAGMSEDIIVNKFLVLGASGKTGVEGATGGFGKAKELLILPWVGWGIESLGVVITGQNINYDIKRSGHKHQGTRLSVLMSEDQCTAIRMAENYIKKCYLPHVKFTLSYPDPDTGKQVERAVSADSDPGREVERIGEKAIVYYKDPVEGSNDMTSLASIMVNGLSMFHPYLYDHIRGKLTVFLQGDTKLILTANRDGFKDQDLERGLNQIFKKLAKSSERLYREKSGLVKKKFKGRGKFQGSKREEKFRAMLNKQLFGKDTPLRETKDSKLVFIYSDEVEKDVREILKPVQPEAAVPPQQEDEAVGFQIQLTVAEAVVQAITSLQFAGPNHVEAAIKQLAWEPDYFLWNEVSGFTIPKAFFPESMSAKVLKILRMWTELCRFILIQLQCGTPFGVGFMFSSDVAGAFLNDDEGDKWLLLNPFVPMNFTIAMEHAYGGSGKVSIDPELGNMYNLSDDRMIALMYAVAVHEVTHMADDITYHDESFSTALTYNFARTSGMDKQVRQILKAVRRRR